MERESVILDVRDLETDFISGGQKIAAVDHIGFTLKKGETMGIVGESGSGKSVTALSIMQLVSPPGKITSGEILFHEKDQQVVNLLSLNERQIQKIRGRKIAMIFQEPMTSLNPVFTCGYQVMEAITLHRKESKAEASDRTFSLFEKVKLTDAKRIFNAYPHQLSGGQKQRVMIAMAISCNPALLIADEPTTSLDVTVQARILELLEELRMEQELSMIFITHDLAVVAEVADRIAVMYKGKIVEQGTVNEIFSHPKHPYTKGLLACRPTLDKKLKRLPVIQDFMMEEQDGTVRDLPVSVKDVMERNEMLKDEVEKRLLELQRQQPILSVKNLCAYFSVRKSVFGEPLRYVKAVDDVSFDVYPGETLGLVGESGSGKTTLGRTILRLIHPAAGDVIFEGQHLERLPEEEMRRVRKHLQIIFQDPYSSLNPRLSVGYSIMEPMKVHGLYDSDKERREKAFDLLDKVNMPVSSFDRFPHEFSGGQRQRVCIARALSLNPKLIICDESVSALDVSIQAQVLNLLLQLREELLLSYIFISHDLSIVKFMSDRMIVMNNGKIEEMGKADEIYHHPSSDYTMKLIQAIPKGDPGIVRRKADQQQWTH